MKQLSILIALCASLDTFAHKACSIYPKLNYNEIKTFGGSQAVKKRIISCKDMMAVHFWRKEQGMQSIMQLRAYHYNRESLDKMQVRL